MKINLKKLYVQRKYWKPHGRSYLCWGVFCVDDNVEVDFENIQMMCCIFFYQNLVIRINPRIPVRKGLISYYKKNGIIFLKMWI